VEDDRHRHAVPRGLVSPAEQAGSAPPPGLVPGAGHRRAGGRQRQQVGAAAAAASGAAALRTGRRSACGPFVSPSLSFEPLMLRRPDSRRSTTQTWYFCSGMLTCGLPRLVVQVGAAGDAHTHTPRFHRG